MSITMSTQEKQPNAEINGNTPARQAICLFVLAALLCLARYGSAQEQSPSPTATAATNSDTNGAPFAQAVQVDLVRDLAIQHEDLVKTWDSFARQAIRQIYHYRTLKSHSRAQFYGSASIDSPDHLFLVLDMMFSQGNYARRDFIYVQSLPLRNHFAGLLEHQRGQEIVATGHVSPEFLQSSPVMALVREIAANTKTANAAQKVYNGQLRFFENLSSNFKIIPPRDGSRKWQTVDALFANVPGLLQHMQSNPAPPLEGYEQEVATKILEDYAVLAGAWAARNAEEVNARLNSLAQQLPALSPVYPSLAKRQVENTYNRYFKFTILGGAFYGMAFVGFMIAFFAQIRWMRPASIAIFLLGFAIHTAGLMIRWWLAERMPITNQFESVMMAAWSGCLIGLIIELFHRKGLIGLGAAFVGWMALIACFSVPFVFGKAIGEEISQPAGILTNIWILYVHINMVTASYALIGIGFAISVLYLVGRMFGSASERLRTIDASNLVILQLAFWVLGTGIMLGAWWASISWGRPWGWDPKETFALVTWLVYLVVVHLRFVVKDKGLWTAILGVIGFGIMLFNWIGVNYFLVGLHSYA